MATLNIVGSFTVKHLDELLTKHRKKISRVCWKPTNIELDVSNCSIEDLSEMKISSIDDLDRFLSNR